MDNPIDILQAAGVECEEVEEWVKVASWLGIAEPYMDARLSRSAILALARLVAKWKHGYDELDMEPNVRYVRELEADVAKYKWQRDYVLDGVDGYDAEEGWATTAGDPVADLNARWEAHHVSSQ
jgi:hypothetical protein